MAPRLRIVAGGAAILLVILLVLAIVSRQAGEASAYTLVDETTLLVLSGQVEVQRAGASFAPVAGQTALRPGDRVRTMADSYAVITYFEGSSTSLDPLTEIAIQRLDRADTQVLIAFHQEVGLTWNRVERLVNPVSRFETNTSTGVAYVRGTEYLVLVDRDQQTTVEAVTDEVIVESIVDGQTFSVAVTPGLRTIVRPRREPSSPAPAPASPRALRVEVEGPVRPFLTDRLGRSVGFHPQADAYTSQIPGAKTRLVERQWVVSVPNPLDSYELTLKGAAQRGSYVVALTGLSGGEPQGESARLVGEIELGKLVSVSFELRDGQIVNARIAGPVDRPSARSRAAFVKAQEGSFAQEMALAAPRATAERRAETTVQALRTRERADAGLQRPVGGSPEGFLSAAPRQTPELPDTARRPGALATIAAGRLEGQPDFGTPGPLLLTRAAERQGETPTRPPLRTAPPTRPLLAEEADSADPTPDLRLVATLRPRFPTATVKLAGTLAPLDDIVVRPTAAPDGDAPIRLTLVARPTRTPTVRPSRTPDDDVGATREALATPFRLLRPSPTPTPTRPPLRFLATALPAE